VEIKQLIKILKPFILATKYIKNDANHFGVKGLYKFSKALKIKIIPLLNLALI